VFNRYYQDELQYLRELGEEFSKAHPAAAHYLSGPSRDPDVERLLEGVAFLTGRVRQKLDDELPEVTHGLMHLMWPHYLRPVPSMSILEFAPVLQALRQSQIVPRGTEVQSVPVEGTPCRFRTCSEVRLHPLSIDAVSLEARAAGPTTMRLRFKLWNQVKADKLQLEPLRLFLHGDAAMTTTLYHHLCRHVESARACVEAGGEGRPITLEPAGFAENEALLPYPPGASPGYRLLQEYFSLPEKFMFVDIHGLGRVHELAVGDRFEVEIHFDRALEPTLRPSREDIRLFCAPIVNLFPHEADPIRLERTQTEYRLRPSGKDSMHYEVFSVDRVVAYPPGGGEERELSPFYQFARPDGSTYMAHLRSSVVDDRVDTYVSFVDAKGATLPPEAETVSFELTCTNRRLAEALRVGDVQVPTDTSPAFVGFRNLTAPTSSVAPPLDGDLPWRLISHLSLNYVTLASVEALRGVLGLYNFQGMRDPRVARANALRLEGLQAIHAKPAERLSGGGLLRGTALTLDVLEDRYAGDGDLYLFATILNEYLSLHGTLNAFTQLTVRGLQRGEETTWPCRIGRDRL
jgi:type VI secretion system protein ImpG